MAFVPGTDEYVIGTGQIILWHSRSGAKCCQVLSNGFAITVAVTPDSHKFVIARQSGAFIVDTGRPGRPREVRLGTVMTHDAEFSPDGSEVVTADADGTVDVFRLATGKVIAKFTSSDTNADAASFSPDGKRVVAGYLTGTGRVWDVTSKLQLTLLAGHGDPIATARFSPDGREVVTSSDDGTVRVWHAAPQELRTEFTVPPNSSAAVPLNWVDYIGSRIIAWDPDGNAYLLTSSGTVQQDFKAASFRHGG